MKTRLTDKATGTLCPLFLCALRGRISCSLFFEYGVRCQVETSCITERLYPIGRALRNRKLMKAYEIPPAASCSLVRSFSPLMKQLSKSLESSSCCCAICTTKGTTVCVFTLWDLWWKSFQAFGSSPMPLSPTYSYLITMSLVASEVIDSEHQTLLLFCLKSGSSLAYTTFGAL